MRGGEVKGGTHGPLLFGLRLTILFTLLPLVVLAIVRPESVGWALVSIPDSLRIFGAVLAAAMLPCLIGMFAHLGRNITPTANTREGHQLVTTGPYHWIRHPLYTFGFLFWFGISFALALWVIPMILIPSMILVGARIPREERNLLREFGDEYRQYAERTGRFIPKFP